MERDRFARLQYYYIRSSHAVDEAYIRFGEFTKAKRTELEIAFVPLLSGFRAGVKAYKEYGQRKDQTQASKNHIMPKER